MNSSFENRQDIYTRITAGIVAEFEKGTQPWVRPWKVDHATGRMTRPLRHNGEPYSGINVLSLWASSNLQGFAAPFWMTFRQAMELKAHVRQGEKGSPVVYVSVHRRKETDANIGDEVERAVQFLKGYTVFNVEQIEGLPSHFYAWTEQPRGDSSLRIDRAHRFFAATGAVVNHGGSQAYYRPSSDAIVMPPLEVFADAESYYATLGHETTHWTGHPSRLARDFGSRRFGSEAYAAEELVAELGAAFLCADLDLSLEPREDHAWYIASWLKVLKEDPRAIFTAATHALRAADFLQALQPSVGASALVPAAPGT